MSDRISWTWRHAVCKSDLNPTTRHVLLTLSCWMNEFGGACYPTTKKLSIATGLSERSVCTHLEKAHSTGWINRKRHGFAGQKWANHEYEPSFPPSEGAEPSSVRTQEGTEPNDTKALKEVQCNVPVTSPEEEYSTKPSKGRLPYALGFHEFWKAWSAGPNDPKKPAYTLWKKLSADDHSDLLASLPKYQRFLRENSHPQCHARTYISQRRWEGFTSDPDNPSELPTVARGSKQWHAWLEYKRSVGEKTSVFERLDSPTVPTEWPLGHPSHQSDPT